MAGDKIPKVFWSWNQQDFLADWMVDVRETLVSRYLELGQTSQRARFSAKLSPPQTLAENSGLSRDTLTFNLLATLWGIPLKRLETHWKLYTHDYSFIIEKGHKLEWHWVKTAWTPNAKLRPSEYIALSTHRADNTQSITIQGGSPELSIQSVYWGFTVEAWLIESLTAHVTHL